MNLLTGGTKRRPQKMKLKPFHGALFSTNFIRTNRNDSKFARNRQASHKIITIIKIIAMIRGKYIIRSNLEKGGKGRFLSCKKRDISISINLQSIT